MSAIWDALRAKVYVWTNRPKQVSETDSALKLAIRTAHRQGKFWKDLAIVSYPIPDGEQIQSISIPDWMPRFRQLAWIKNTETETEFTETSPSDLLDFNGYKKVGVYWGIGTSLNIRLASDTTALEFGYYLQPITDPESPTLQDWLLTDYEDVIVLMAAGTILSFIGEQEIKSRVDSLLLLAVADLVSDSLEVTGR